MATPDESSTAIAPAMEAPAIQAPEIQAPAMQAPVVQAPATQAPPIQDPGMEPRVSRRVSNANVPSNSSTEGLPPVRLKSALKAQNAGVEVTKKVGKNMVGSQVERATGNTLPYNMWGPCNPTRFGPVGEMPPSRGHRYNYQGKQETLMKDRLEERDFGHVRHHCYRKNLVEPTGVDSLAWMDPKRKEFWRTDVERVLKRDEENRRARQKELLENMTNEEAWRRHNAQKMRDMKYQAYLDLSENMQKVGCRNNMSGAPHINIITRESIGEHNIKAVKFRDDCTAYKRVQRTLMLRERNSGARNYNILNWTKNSPGPELPVWPEKPPSPPPPPPLDTRTPLNSSKGAISCSRVYGSFGKFNIP